jgi:hypothetical protein
MGMTKGLRGPALTSWAGVLCGRCAWPCTRVLALICRSVEVRPLCTCKPIVQDSMRLFANDLIPHSLAGNMPSSDASLFP